LRIKPLLSELGVSDSSKQVHMSLDSNDTATPRYLYRNLWLCGHPFCLSRETNVFQQGIHFVLGRFLGHGVFMFIYDIVKGTETIVKIRGYFYEVI
jgi:hypothetical protein